MILVRAAPSARGKGTARMAVVLKINPGFDASYPWRQIGTGTQPAAASRLEYYLAPADKGGEPAGRWAGGAVGGCHGVGVKVDLFFRGGVVGCRGTPPPVR